MSKVRECDFVCTCRETVLLVMRIEAKSMYLMIAVVFMSGLILSTDVTGSLSLE